MTMPSARKSLLALGCATLLASTGCAKRVLVEAGTFETQERVALTLSGGRTVTGRIDSGSRVDYWDQGSLYRAQVDSVTADRIVLRNLVLLRQDDSTTEVARRQADSRLRVAEAVPEVSLSRTEVEKVELIQFDFLRSVRNTGFWTFGAAMAVLLLGERS